MLNLKLRLPKKVRVAKWKARPENKVARRAYDLNEKYGLSIEKYDELLIESCGKCALCGKPFDNYIREPAVDHNHVTGEIRGLLHAKCNKAIGLFNEDTAALLNAIKYLTQSSLIT